MWPNIWKLLVLGLTKVSYKKETCVARACSELGVAISGVVVVGDIF